jgi:hypothetical protein
MVENERTDIRTYEAILVSPIGNSRDQLEKAYDLVSDLLDLTHETIEEILGNLNGNTRQITEMELTRTENGLLMAQKFLNGLIEAKNEKAIE